MRTALILLTTLCLLILPGCQTEEQVTDTQKPATGADNQPPTVNEVEAQEPPKPPIMEDFDGKPKMSLFPRILDDYRPEDSATEGVDNWRTFLAHLKRVSGPAMSSEAGNRGWQFHSVNTIDSVGYFSPLAVDPDSTYQVKFRIKTDLADGATAGIKVLEFSKFQWLGEQYPESLYRSIFVDQQAAPALTGQQDWTEQSFDFKVGPQTRMIHLVLYRQGPHDTNDVMFDDLYVNVLAGQ